MNIIMAKRELIFTRNKYFKSCHASTLIVLHNKDILTAWFGGSHEGSPDVGIWISKRQKGKWNSPKKVSVHENIPHWNPVLLQDDEGRIFLFYKIGDTIPGWYTMVTSSVDYGDTWIKVKVLVEGDIGGRGPVKNKIIKLKDGTWLAPASIEGEYWDAFVDVSCDFGKTWTKSEAVPIKRLNVDSINNNEMQQENNPEFKGRGVIQPSLWESETGIVHMLLRSTEGYIYRSDSKDGGRKWCTAYRTNLPNNNSGIDLTCLDNGVLALVYNPVSKEWGPRNPLTLSMSYDNGITWSDILVLQNKENDNEYSYPAIVSVGNELFITYTWKRESIAFWNILLD